MPYFLVSFLLFFLPLLVFPFGVSPFESPKIIIALLGIEFLAVAVFYYKLQPKISTLSATIPIIYVAILLLTAVHLILYGFTDAFFGNIYRLNGIFLLGHLMVFALITSRIPIKRHSFVYLAVLTILFVSCFFILPNKADRIIGTIGEPNSLAVAVNFLFLTALFFSPGKNKLIMLLIFIIAFAILLLTRSSSGILAFLVQLMFLFIVKKFNRPWLFAVCVCLLFIIPAIVYPILEKPKFYEDRAKIWSVCFNAGLQKPLYGHGFGNTDKAVDTFSRQNQNILNFQKVDSCHNLFLDWWITGGIIGLILIMALIISSFYHLAMSGNLILASLLIGVVTASLFNPLNINGQLFFWYLLGQGFGKQAS